MEIWMLSLGTQIFPILPFQVYWRFGKTLEMIHYSKRAISRSLSGKFFCSEYLSNKELRVFGIDAKAES